MQSLKDSTGYIQEYCCTAEWQDSSSYTKRMLLQYYSGSVVIIMFRLGDQSNPHTKQAFAHSSDGKFVLIFCTKMMNGCFFRARISRSKNIFFLSDSFSGNVRRSVLLNEYSSTRPRMVLWFIFSFFHFFEVSQDRGRGVV